ncbi:hypothetical protein [Arthrobacter sp. UYEF3]|uniref:hypothetical protein n=1 Tax=Arthrobacter sp. UYEF3 TaxID=1756365 RepID=UPI0033990010
MGTNHRPLQRSRQPFRTPEPVRDLTDLHRDDEVDVRLNGQVIASGRIDMRALDGTVFWLLQNNGWGQKMILQSEGLTVQKRARDERP